MRSLSWSIIRFHTDLKCLTCNRYYLFVMCYWISFSWLKIISSPFRGFILLIWLFHKFWVPCSFQSSYKTSGESTLWGLKEPNCLLLIGSACAWAFTFALIGKWQISIFMKTSHSLCCCWGKGIPILGVFHLNKTVLYIVWNLASIVIAWGMICSKWNGRWYMPMYYYNTKYSSLFSPSSSPLPSSQY